MMMDGQRLDLWLYYTRLAKTRGLCAAFIRKGRVRINGQRTHKTHARLRLGDIVSFASPHRQGEVCVWRVMQLGERRGPAREAALLYERIEEKTANF
ncbi:RNA-binding S4 domain-containing protein [Parasaccharibacter sp. TMW 2.1888]|uniref:Heat-shock protein n=3 Tax=Acetobacteraceae TaxID=433 RepID=A0ABX4ZM99_9PROT|nr:MULTISPECIES: S4 domain-containing protein [Acetobacteraceae]MCL1511146.1 RNA-binding S4 domain-containing protein [Parasaccharibacter sp. TMW 2.1884]MCL1513168.1 RNA-binding S4 domain-containing protein [Parasaccharibacter sp. TMW 2.1891]MCL1514743.1 heat-shock protein [Parasaccharibacter sp. TMW2.1890]MCL1561971.1 RNA-binding S4 domain-containing protein [Parasaccharibacter sp. TMW 2.1886]MCQ0042025.1 S4 domain-containing protein [Bombella sp.]MUG79247.1 RNA-binding S4 domain-containing 